MTEQENEFITHLLIRYSYEAILAGIVVFLLIKFFLPGYLTEKGKNLATSEDIDEITNKIELVRSSYSVLLEELKSKHQLKLAAIDRRLEVHQEAFTLWRELVSKTHTEEIISTVIKCQNWWDRNCLYLESEAREAFSNAYHAAAAHDGLLQAREIDAIKKNWSNIIEAGQIIVEAMQLPRLTDTELKKLDSNNGK